MHAVEVRQLRREFDGKRGAPPVVALDNVDLTVPAGTVLGLLGPNGAGKTTLVKILATILLPTSGTVRVLGRDVAANAADVKPLIGLVLGGDRGLYTRVSARNNLLFWAALYRIPKRQARPRCEAMLERCGLRDRADEPVERFSRGMKQRLHLARGLLHEPQLVMLDEPTVGMDPVATLEFRHVVRQLKAEGRTVLLTTHDMAEAEELCDEVSLIDRGEIKFTGSTARVGRLLSGYDRIDFAASQDDVAHRFAALPGVVGVSRRGPGTWRAEVAVNGADRADLIGWLAAQGVADLQTAAPSLEEIYLQVLDTRGMVL